MSAGTSSGSQEICRPTSFETVLLHHMIEESLNTQHSYAGRLNKQKMSLAQCRINVDHWSYIGWTLMNGLCLLVEYWYWYTIYSVTFLVVSSLTALWTWLCACGLSYHANIISINLESRTPLSSVGETELERLWRDKTRLGGVCLIWSPPTTTVR